MAQASVEVRLNNWESDLKITSLSLQQTYNQHHLFELSTLIPVDHRLSVNKLEDILGERVYLCIKTDEGNECRFWGIVDQVLPRWTSHGVVLSIKGYSPTVLMDCVPRFRTFSEKTIRFVLDKVLDDYSAGRLPKTLCYARAGKMPYIAQLQETDYRFLCRLADRYQQLFFYDGQQLFFGEIDECQGELIELDFKKSSNHLEISLNLSPLSFQLNGYDLKRSNNEWYNAYEKITNDHPLVMAGLRKSSIYEPQTMRINHLVEGKKELETIASSIRARQAHELVRLNGSSNNPALKIGSRIVISNSDELLDEGTYIITSVRHRVSQEGVYNNSFTAVPAGYPFPIRMQENRSPICGPLMAIVRDNNDPKHLGRVRLEFIGDEEKSLSPWLRVLVPYTKFGGMYFLPEIGDQVVVFQEDFNMEKSAFVMGCFYHGNAGAQQWKDDANRKKGIAMDKINIFFDDRSGKLTIKADEIEIRGEKAVEINGGRQLTHKAKRIDLN